MRYIIYCSPSPGTLGLGVGSIILCSPYIDTWVYDIRVIMRDKNIGGEVALVITGGYRVGYDRVGVMINIPCVVERYVQ